MYIGYWTLNKYYYYMYKWINVFTLYKGLYQSSYDILFLFMKYLMFSPIIVLKLYQEYKAILECMCSLL